MAAGVRLSDMVEEKVKAGIASVTEQADSVFYRQMMKQ